MVLSIRPFHSLIHISKPYASANRFASFQFFQYFFLKAFSLIPDAYNDPSLIPFCGNMHLSLPVPANAVTHCIFHNGLKDERRNSDIHSFRQIIGHLQLVFKARLLNLQVVSDMLEFFLHRDHIPALAQIIAEILRQYDQEFPGPPLFSRQT